MARGRHRGRHRSTGTPTKARRLVALTVPALVVAGTSLGIAAWPDAEDARTLEEPTRVIQTPERTQAVSRSRQRAPMSDASGGARAPFALEAADSPSPPPTKAQKPTTKPTKKPKPTPTRADTPTETPGPTVVGSLYTTVNLNVRAEPSADAELIAVLERGTKVSVTDVRDDSWVLIILGDERAWVSTNYLSETKPAEEPEDFGDDSGGSGGDDDGGGISDAECASGSEVEQGLAPDAIAVHRAVCAEFPDVTSYGGVRPNAGNHTEGKALDIMVYDNSDLGDAIAEWVRANYAELGVSEVIWAQHIWTVQRADEGWRWMEDRGSDTANHYDHVHVTVYGYETQ